MLEIFGISFTRLTVMRQDIRLVIYVNQDRGFLFWGYEKIFNSRIGSRMEHEIFPGLPGSRDLSHSKEHDRFSKKNIFW